MKKLFFFFMFLGIVLFGNIIYVSAESTSESEYKFNNITVKFVDALTLEPIVDSKISAQYDKLGDGNVSEEEYYTTDANGEIKVPINGRVHIFRSDKADNINYLKLGSGIVIDDLDEPNYTVYLSPIFNIQVELKTDFNFLLSFFRMFKYGSYLEASASQLNSGSLAEPSCFMSTLKKGVTIKQYDKTINIKAYFSRDLNSPTKESYKCSIYAWESIRNVAGIKQIDFASMNRSQTNNLELPLNMSYKNLINEYPSINFPSPEQ